MGFYLYRPPTAAPFLFSGRFLSVSFIEILKGFAPVVTMVMQGCFGLGLPAPTSVGIDIYIQIQIQTEI